MSNAVCKKVVYMDLMFEQKICRGVLLHRAISVQYRGVSCCFIWLRYGCSLLTHEMCYQFSLYIILLYLRSTVCFWVSPLHLSPLEIMWMLILACKHQDCSCGQCQMNNVIHHNPSWFRAQTKCLGSHLKCDCLAAWVLQSDMSENFFIFNIFSFSYYFVLSTLLTREMKCFMAASVQ